METIRWLFSQQGFWAVLGALSGALIAAFTNFLIHRRQERKERRIARMRVATDLRGWMNRAADSYYETYNWISSKGHAGKVHLAMPEFGLESTLEAISRLDNKTSGLVFNLIHEKDDANREVEGVLEWEDEDEAADRFLRLSLTAILNALDIYSKISKSLGWNHKVFDDQQVSALKRELECHHKKQQKRQERVLQAILKEDS